MKIVIQKKGDEPPYKTVVDTGVMDVELRDVFLGVGIRTDQGYFGIAQRDDGIEILLDGKLVWSSTMALGNAPVTAGTPHGCAGSSPNGGHGPAVDSCHEDDDGRYWVGNDEYVSQVAFCPYCGAEAPTKPTCGFHRKRVFCRGDYGHAGEHDVPTRREGQLAKREAM